MVSTQPSHANRQGPPKVATVIAYVKLCPKEQLSLAKGYRSCWVWPQGRGYQTLRSEPSGNQRTEHQPITPKGKPPNLGCLWGRDSNLPVRRDRTLLLSNSEGWRAPFSRFLGSFSRMVKIQSPASLPPDAWPSVSLDRHRSHSVSDMAASDPWLPPLIPTQGPSFAHGDPTVGPGASSCTLECSAPASACPRRELLNPPVCQLLPRASVSLPGASSSQSWSSLAPCSPSSPPATPTSPLCSCPSAFHLQLSPALVPHTTWFKRRLLNPGPVLSSSVPMSPPTHQLCLSHLHGLPGCPQSTRKTRPRGWQGSSQPRKTL